MPIQLIVAFSVTLSIGLSPLAHGKRKSRKAHSHGEAKLSLITNNQEVLADLEAPAEGIYGFEHKPKNKSQEKAMKDGLERLKSSAAQLVVFDADLKCQVKDVTIESLTHDEDHGHEHHDKKKKKKKKTHKAHDHDDEDHHADVHAEIRYTCAKSVVGTKVKIGVSKVFPRIKKTLVTTIRDKSQSRKAISSRQEKSESISL